MKHVMANIVMIDDDTGHQQELHTYTRSRKGDLKSGASSYAGDLDAFLTKDPRPDLFLLDIRLPKFPPDVVRAHPEDQKPLGIGLARKIRECKMTADIPIVLYSIYIDTPEVRTALAAAPLPANTYLTPKYHDVRDNIKQGLRRVRQVDIACKQDANELERFVLSLGPNVSAKDIREDTILLNGESCVQFAPLRGGKEIWVCFPRESLWSADENYLIVKTVQGKRVVFLVGP